MKNLLSKMKLKCLNVQHVENKTLWRISSCVVYANKDFIAMWLVKEKIGLMGINKNAKIYRKMMLLHNNPLNRKLKSHRLFRNMHQIIRSKRELKHLKINRIHHLRLFKIDLLILKIPNSNKYASLCANATRSHADAKFLRLISSMNSENNF